MQNWRKSESDVEPLLTEQLKDGRMYVRRKVKTEERTGMDGKVKVMYVYEETIMNETEYHDYQIKKLRALVDYVAMETGVDLDE